MKVKFRAGKYREPVNLEIKGARIELEFGYNPILLDEIKSMEGAKWHGYDEENPRKIWSITNNQRNLFQIAFLRYDKKDPETYDPYAPYDAPLIQHSSERPLYKHQFEMVSHVITRRKCILAAEMGTGKTLVAIEAMEWAVKNAGVDPEDILYIGPEAALQQVQLDFEEWECDFRPEFMTYPSLRVAAERWKPGTRAPKFVVFDESSRLKTHTAKQSIAARHLANAIRAEHGHNGFVVLMSGSPAPKNPADWWHQCEVACPGFIKEGTYEKFKRRLAIIQMKENELGQGYPKLVSWLDDDKKCGTCGKPESDDIHGAEARVYSGEEGHPFKKTKNEVAMLYERMRGLVLVKFKKDCLDLPKKIYKTIKVRPKLETLNAAKIIVKRARTAVQALVLLRELSDGFQYKDVEIDQVKCPDCVDGLRQQDYDPDAPDEPISQEALISGKPLAKREVSCDRCGGSAEIPVTERQAKQVPCPKEDALRELLEEHDDVGRLAIYAGFTGSVDRVVSVCLNMGWHVVRVDGRGWVSLNPDGAAHALPVEKSAMYKAFRYGQEAWPKIAFVAQASSAGMGLNLTASPTMVFYSNDFNFESRIQAEDRNHRPGIEKTLAKIGQDHVTIVDIVHLESDQVIIDNHAKKRKLQGMSMGVLAEALDRVGDRQF